MRITLGTLDVASQNGTMAHAVTHKLQVVDRPPKRFKELQFGIQYELLFDMTASIANYSSPRSHQDIVNQAVLEVCSKDLYDVSQQRKPVINGALDPKLVRRKTLSKI